MRILSALAGVLSVLATYGLTAYLFGRWAGLIAGVVQLTTFQFVYLHGTRDAIIPHSHSERLDAASKHSRLESMACGHNDCPRPWAAIRAFLVANGIVDPEASS